MKIVRIATIAAVVGGMGLSSAAQARLLRQEVIGAWRYCVYQVPTTIGTRNPRERIGATGERTTRVGRGEPCPVSIRLQAQPRQAPATGHTAWPSPR